MGRRNNSSSSKKKNKSDIEEPSMLLIYRPYGARYRHLHTSVYSITATEESKSRFDAESNLTRKEASAIRKKIIKAHCNDPLGTSYSSSTSENTAGAGGDLPPDIPVYSKPSSKHFIFGSKEVYKTSPERLTTKIETALYSYKNPLIPLASVDAPMFKPCIITIGTHRMVFRRWSKSWRKPRGFTAENGNYYYWSWDLNDVNNYGEKVVKSVTKLHKRTATLYKNEGDVVSAVAWLRPAVGLRKGMKVGKVGKSGEMVGDGRVGKMWRRGYVLKVSGKVREAEAVVTALVMLDEVWHPSVRGMGGKEVDGTKG